MDIKGLKRVNTYKEQKKGVIASEILKPISKRNKARGGIESHLFNNPNASKEDYIESQKLLRPIGIKSDLEGDDIKNVITP